KQSQRITHGQCFQPLTTGYRGQCVANSVVPVRLELTLPDRSGPGPVIRGDRHPWRSVAVDQDFRVRGLDQLVYLPDYFVFARDGMPGRHPYGDLVYGLYGFHFTSTSQGSWTPNPAARSLSARGTRDRPRSR